MKKTRHTTEQIIRILREAEGSERSNEEVCRQHNISPQTYYRWKSKYGGMNLQEAQRLRHLERENTELKQLLAEQLLKTKALEIALEKTSKPGAATSGGGQGEGRIVVLRASRVPVAKDSSWDPQLPAQASDRP